MPIITGGPSGGTNDWAGSLSYIAQGTATVATSTELKIAVNFHPELTGQYTALSRITFLDIKGTNFGFDYANGLATSGTVTSITDSSGTSLTGLNVSLVSLWNAVAQGNDATWLALLFGGNDTITASGNSSAQNGGNRYTGGAGDDVFNMQALTKAGDFQLFGGDGNDTFNFKSGYGYTSADYINGGAGTDTLNLDGDYSGNNGAQVATIGIEKINLAAGHSYNLYLRPGDQSLPGSDNASSVTVDGSALGPSDQMSVTFDLFNRVPVTVLGGAGSDTFQRYGNTSGYPSDNDTIDGGGNVDTVSYAGNRSAYTVTQTSTGVFTVSAPLLGTDTLKNVEYLKFADQTVRLLPGQGTTVDWSADPSTYMANIRDFDGVDLGGASSWKLIGTADVNGDGTAEHIFFNRQIGRWAEVSTEADGKTYFDNHGWAGDTRVVGIYIDPLVANGTVVKGSDTDSQRRFQNDLLIDNIHGILGQADYNHDGLQEVYFSLTDGTAYLHAYMHADGNIQYANYQSKQQVIDYLTNNGWSSSTWAGWFPSSQAPLAAGAGG